ncbi:MAG: GerMN domain-containing protein, partial [Actinomyces oris]
MTQEMNRDELTQGRGSAESVESTEPTGTLATAPARLSRRGALGLLSATAAGVLAGCTALPSSSGVTRSGVAASDTNALIETAPGPNEGDSAEDIVNGFLRATIAGFSDDFATAKQFLSDHAVAQWKPLETVSAYSGSTEPQVSVAANGSFTVTSGQVGVLNSLGVFTPAPEGSTYTGEFSLATNSTGQWRIVGLPHGILLPLSRLMQNFAVSSLAFLSRDRSRFVPELRWYPRSSQADSLVSGLLAGPSDWLAKGASSLIPRNAERAGRGVVVEGGTATVHLSADSDPASEDARGLMVAQIEQSLIQISGIDHVRVLAGTVDLGAAAQLTPMAPEVGGIVGMSEGSVVRG